jgi:vancomycin resistance protein YoaR
MRQKRIILAILAVLILAAIGGGSWYIVQMTNQKGYFTGVHIEDVDLSGMTKEEAQEAFDAYWDSLLATEVEIVIGEDTETMTLESLGLTLTSTDILDQAYKLGREGNIFQRAIEIEKMKRSPEVLELSVELAADTEEAALREKTESYEHKKKNAKIKRKKGKFVITDEVNGLAIDYDTSLAALADKVKNDH